MLELVDPAERGYETLPPEAVGGCSGCLSYRPHPKPDGSLEVDPEIHLPSPGMDVDVAYYYNSHSPYQGPYGYGRTISLNLLSQASGSFLSQGGTGVVVTFMRGNGSLESYVDEASGGMVPKVPGTLNTLEADIDAGQWKESSPQGITTVYPMDLGGAVTSVLYAKDAVGNTHTFTYDGGLLSSLEDAVGRLVTLAYASTPSGVPALETIQDWAGRVTTFLYDTDSAPGRNLLRQVTGPSGCQTGYAYDVYGRLASITDPNGYGTTYAYDGQGRVTQRTAATQYHTRYGYSDAGPTITDALGRVTTYVYGRKDGRRSQSAIGGYTSPAGFRWTMTQNVRGQQRSIRLPDGGVWTTLYQPNGMPAGSVDPLGHVTTIVRDAYHNPVQVVYADGSVEETVYGYAGSPFDTTGEKRKIQAQVNALGQRTTWLYESRGLVTATVDPVGARTTYGYDGFGNQTAVTNPLGHTTTYVYDAAGNVVAAVNPLGNRTSSTYDAQGRVLSQEDALGRRTTFAYDGVGNRTVQIDPLGNRTTWTYNVFDKAAVVVNPLGYRTTNLYDGLGRQVAAVDPLGNRTTAVYDAAGHPAAMVDPLGNRTTSLYDASGRRTAVQDALGYRTSTIYDIAGRPVAMQDALGSRTSTVYDAVGRPVATVNPLGYRSSIVYDAAGRQIASIDAAGYRTSTAYDAAGRAVASIDALGYRTSTVYDAAGQPVARIDALGYRTTTVYDRAGRRTARIDALGNRSEIVHNRANLIVANVDPLGYRTTYLYDAAGRTVASINALGYRNTNVYDADGQLRAEVSPLGYRNSYSYDAVGEVTATIDAQGIRTTTAYNAFGRPITIQSPSGFTRTALYDSVGRRIAQIDPTGARVSLIYSALGAVTAKIDEVGRITSTVYDRANREIASVNPLGYVTSMSYDLVDRRIAVTDPLGRITTSVYDANGQALVQVDPLGARLTFSFDPRGQMLISHGPSARVVTNAFDPRGLLKSTTEATGTTTFIYDDTGREIGVESPGGHRFTYTYLPTGLRTSTVNPLGYRSSYVYDPNNRLQEETTPLGHRTTRIYGSTSRIEAIENANGVRSSYIYDMDGYQVALVDGRGSRTTNMFDSRGLVQVSINPLAYRTSYQYNASMERTQRIDARGHVVTYSYDLPERIIGILYPDAGRVTYTFDPAGQRTTMQDRTGIISYTYDVGGRLVAVRSMDGCITYAYDSAGDRTLMQTPRGDITTYCYDAEGRLSSMCDPLTKCTTFEYDSQGHETERIYSGNILGLTSTYDALGRQTSRVYQDGLGIPVASFTATYSPDDAFISVAEIDGTLVSYTHDPLRQLTNEARTGVVPYNVTYIYDEVGNLLSYYEGLSVISYTYNAANQLKNATGESSITSFEYDPSGNLVHVIGGDGTEHSYSWDEDDRLVSVVATDAASTVIYTYTYGADGLRRSQEKDGNVTRYLWDGQNLLMEIGDDSAVEAQYGYLPQLYGEILAEHRSGIDALYGFDLQANTRFLVDATGSVSDKYVFTAFGRVLSLIGDTPNPYLFGGQVGYYADIPERRYYVRARYFDAQRARWMSTDPLGDVDGTNLYTYVRNQPDGSTDPSGLVTCSDLMKKRDAFLKLSKGTKARLLAIRDFYNSIGTYLYFEGYPLAAQNFWHWLTMSGSTQVMDNTAFRSDPETVKRQADTLRCLSAAINTSPCCPGTKDYRVCPGVSVWPTKTDLAAAVGYWALTGKLRCEVTSRTQASVVCDLVWSGHDIYNWNAGASVPCLPNCKMKVYDDWAIEIEKRYGLQYAISIVQWSEPYIVPCGKPRTASKCCDTDQDQMLPPYDWPGPSGCTGVR